MNLFENILKQVNPQAKQAFSQTWQVLWQAFKPAIDTWSQVINWWMKAIQPSIDVVSNIGQSIVQPVQNTIKQAGKLKKANQFLQDKWVSFDDLTALAESEWVSKDEVASFLKSTGLRVQGMETYQEPIQTQEAPNPSLWIVGSIKEWAIGAVRAWEQIPSIIWNSLWFAWNVIGSWLDYITPWLGTWAKQLGQDLQDIGNQVTNAGMTDGWSNQLTQNQIDARKTWGQLALTAPIGGGYLAWSKWLLSLAWRSWLVWAGFGWAQAIVDNWSQTTAWDIAKWAVQWWVTGAIAWPILWKVVAPIIGRVAGKSMKYGTALVKWGTEWLWKSISRDLSAIPAWIQSKAEAISTRANRFNGLDEEKFTKQIWETPGQFAVSRGMTDVWDDAVVKANQNYQQSIKEADKSFSAIEWNFSTKWQKDDIVWELIRANKAKMEAQPRNPDANKTSYLFNKYESGQWLTMSEINDAKRIYQRNHTYTYDQLGSNEAKNSKYLQDAVREWQFKTAKENWLTNIAHINRNTKAWKMYADSLAKKLNRSQANNEFWITDWIALSGGTPENIALFLWKKALQSKYVKSGIIKTLGKQTKPSIIEWSNVWIKQTNFQKNVNRGVLPNMSNVGGESLVRPSWLLPAWSKEALKAQEEAILRRQEKKESTEQAKKILKAEQAKSDAMKSPDITGKSIIRRNESPSTASLAPSKTLIPKKETSIAKKEAIKPSQVKPVEKTTKPTKTYEEYAFDAFSHYMKTEPIKFEKQMPVWSLWNPKKNEIFIYVPRDKAWVLDYLRKKDFVQDAQEAWNKVYRITLKKSDVDSFIDVNKSAKSPNPPLPTENSKTLDS